MKYHRKLPLMRHLSKKMRQLKVNMLLRTQQKLYSSYFKQNGAKADDNIQNIEQLIFEDGDAQEDLVDEEFNIMQYIQALPLDLLQQFRMSNPQIPDIFFMSPQEKKKHFDSINGRFKQKLDKASRRKCKNKKILKFKEEFEVKPFSENQKVVAIPKAQEIYQHYKPDIHFS